MSKHESDDLKEPGYLLPEESQFRLAKLREHIKFLARLAQPRMANETREWAPEVSIGELAICLELLAEQLDLVLEEVSWPAWRTVAANEPGRAAASVATREASHTDAERLAFGVTLDQIDALGRLIQTISAHGDVVAASHAAELAAHTLPLVGQAIYDGVEAVRAILDEVEEQQLGLGLGPRTGVGEARAVYCAVDDLPGSVLSLPAHRPLIYTTQSRTLRLH